MVKKNILRIKESIAAACSKRGWDPGRITIVAVSKGRSIEQIREAVDAGITDIGENRVQEALLKYNQLLGFKFSVLGSRITPNTEHRAPIKWHMVGYLQTNKVKEAVRIFDLIHSVDSLRLAAEIDRQAFKINKVQDILIEVNTSGEENKYGIKPQEASALVKSASGLKNVRLQGLMTIAPIADNPEKARPYFQMLRELRDEISVSADELPIISMGMTDDFKVAVEEGANMVRIGRAIFEG
ncbi:MAG: YggS family pyridoxal phosphate-dependent enzyme [Candidatus Omnitrophota bacterium]